MVRYKQVGPFPGEVYKLAVVGQVLDLQGDQTGLADTGLGVPQTVVLYIALRRLRQELGHLLERTPVFLRVLCDRWKIVNMYTVKSAYKEPVYKELFFISQSLPRSYFTIGL